MKALMVQSTLGLAHNSMEDDAEFAFSCLEWGSHFEI